MKKTFLKCVFAIALLSLTLPVFAGASYHAEVAPTAALLSEHRLQGPGQGTDIVVINYTENTIKVCTPFSCNARTRQTSLRITDNSFDDMPLTLSDLTNGLVFWNGSVPNYSIVSIYVSAGKYVVYVTKS